MARRKTQAKRVFGEISKLPSGRFRARYTGPDLNRHSAPGTFVARIDAEAWLAEQERAISRGDWRVPKKVVAQAPETLGEYAKAVVARRKLRPATVALYDKLLRLTIEIEVLSVAQLERYLLAVPEARRVPLLLAGWCGLRSRRRGTGRRAGPADVCAGDGPVLGGGAGRTEEASASARGRAGCVFSVSSSGLGLTGHGVSWRVREGCDNSATFGPACEGVQDSIQCDGHLVQLPVVDGAADQGLAE